MATQGFWQACAKCGGRTKASPDQVERGTGRVVHVGCQPENFKAQGTSFKVNGFAQVVKWGDSENRKPERAKAPKKASKPKATPKTAPARKAAKAKAAAK